MFLPGAFGYVDPDQQRRESEMIKQMLAQQQSNLYGLAGSLQNYQPNPPPKTPEPNPVLLLIEE